MNRKAASASATARAAAPGPSARTKNAPHEVRIIGGQWKRTRLQVADRPGLRPTPDRVRETLFNWLGQDLTGWQCVDVFAGTGALGFEAASRGAARVRMFEMDASLVVAIETTRVRLGADNVTVERGDGIAGLGRLAAASADLVFLDPPFDADLFEPAVRAAARVLSADGYLYLEAPGAWGDEAAAASGLRVHRHLKAGAVHAHLLATA
ncbi:16S rRNA (guanine(966)-N(2))-methyltransferase RsmD [Variovorax sp. VNK109]|uniref:16S rRNA (guanine(966)-N(2))-methyltransferase RsmD n=1 Tax=Variovorax sp. VNK109 TaxID=3400919 RepID=UPI003C061403